MVNVREHGQTLNDPIYMPSHGGNRGSNPLGDASNFNYLDLDQSPQRRIYGKFTARLVPDVPGRIARPERALDERVALMAADKVYERAWGKPKDYNPKDEPDPNKPRFDPRLCTPDGTRYKIRGPMVQSPGVNGTRYKIRGGRWHQVQRRTLKVRGPMVPGTA